MRSALFVRQSGEPFLQDGQVHGVARRRGVLVKKQTIIVLAVLLLATGAACDSSKRPPPPPILSSAIVADGRAAPVAKKAGLDSVDPGFLVAARDARIAAENLAKTCTIYGSYDEEFRRFHDYCSWKKADLEALRAAATNIRARVPDAGAGALFAEHVRLFVEWAEESAKASTTRGTLSHYQDLARAWNSFQPSDRVPVDIGKRNASLDDQDIKLPKSDEDAGVTLQWQRCSEGPCVVVVAPPKKK